MKKLLLTVFLCLAVTAPNPAFSLVAGNAASGAEPRVMAPAAGLPGSQTAWRLRIREAAVVHDSVVRLGDIAEPLGNVAPDVWRQWAAYPLWPSPESEGRPMQISRQRLVAALSDRLGELADACLLPNSLAVQRGGAVLLEDDLRGLVVRTLTPRINLLGGRGELKDFRLPAYAFIAHEGQSVVLETADVAPGRIGVRFAVREMDGTALRRFTGSVFLDLWMDVPCAARPLNRGDAVTPDAVAHMSVNLAYQKGGVWDGRGGPWQIVRPIGASQPILASDLIPLAAVRRGDRVTLLYRRGNVALRVLVEALEEGGPGDVIAVRNLDSKKQVYGMVLDSGTVQAK
jgi:flagella basal body P-ring formation protein FlgA